MQNEYQPSEYQTSDYWIATSLVASHNQLIAHRKGDGEKIHWTFLETPEMLDSLEGHFNNTLCLPVQDIYAAQRLLKNQFKQFKQFTL
jgi:hypothetical protein